MSTPTGSCVDLQCQQRPCAPGADTTVSGTVYDPAGKNPLYNVVVYVPNQPVAPLTSGATCDACADLYTGQPIAAAVTDSAGKFTIPNAPVGTDIPLVIQIGKWRKQTKISNVAACVDNPQPDRSLTLPKNQSEGDIPNIAISTGFADTLECLLRRIGVDASEYVPGAAPEGRIHIFQGSAFGPPGAPGAGGGAAGGGATAMPGPGGMGGAFPCPNGRCPTTVPNTDPPGPSSSEALWQTADELMKYDILLLSCEGVETRAMNQQALHDYASAGGRVFASHFHYAWFNTGPYGNENLATWTAGGNDIGNIQASIVTTLPDGTPFAKGVALLEWLGHVNALSNGMLAIEQARHNADVSAANTPSQPWIVADQNAMAPGATQYFSFNTPTDVVVTPDGMQQQCGRVVFSDLHVGAASGDDPRQPVPTSCTDVDLSAQEKALEFMLFDLSSCVTPDTRPPAPPEIL
jgi:hypothetical protein